MPEGRHILSLQEGHNNLRRSGRTSNMDNEASTSSGTSHQRHSYVEDAPSTSRAGTSRSSRSSRSQVTTRRRTTGTHRRKYKRRRTKTVIIEYEEGENGKCPVTKTVKRRVKRRKVGHYFFFSTVGVQTSSFMNKIVSVLAIADAQAPNAHRGEAHPRARQRTRAPRRSAPGPAPGRAPPRGGPLPVRAQAEGRHPFSQPVRQFQSAGLLLGRRAGRLGGSRRRNRS